MMKTNKQKEMELHLLKLIIEELRNAIGDTKREDYLVLFEEDFEKFATTLLEKLQVLDREKVEETINDIYGAMCLMSAGYPINIKQFIEQIVPAICQLIPNIKDEGNK